jgi:hypothetical protein
MWLGLRSSVSCASRVLGTLSTAVRITVPRRSTVRTSDIYVGRRSILLHAQSHERDGLHGSSVRQAERLVRASLGG